VELNRSCYKLSLCLMYFVQTKNYIYSIIPPLYLSTELLKNLFRVMDTVRRVYDKLLIYARCLHRCCQWIWHGNNYTNMHNKSKYIDTRQTTNNTMWIYTKQQIIVVLDSPMHRSQITVTVAV